ncbi:MAG: AmmeMemoRadiSam system radical SAM enzyme [Brevinematales bacterium]|nr:AmmeMemoRadiSam system radical SAM enzyme [Brevinematales bacterium]
MKEALFWSQEKEGVRCELCPHHCFLREGKVGLCGARKVRDGRLVSLNYARVAGMAVDPIEKKPLFHFYPGARIFSVGTVGCNLRCPFCQNAGLSRFFDDYHGDIEEIDEISVESLVALVERSGGEKMVAYTYSEPVVWYEYVLEAMRACREKRIKNVVVTNGFIESRPLEGWVPFLDAANVDLKSFQQEGYKKLGGSLDPVKRTIQRLFEAGVHVEVTTLVVPGVSDSLEAMEALSSWLSSLSPEIPLHLSRYFPHYHYHEPPTTLDLLHRMREVATKHLFHVYIGNVVEDASTFCPGCGKILIRRSGYLVERVGLHGGKCSHCGRSLWGRYED